jgi:pimeloyl-ACP methyl ester carboxylesterase
MDRRTFLKVTASTAAATLAAGRAAAAVTSDPVAIDALHAQEFRRKRRFVKLPAGKIAYVEEGSGPAALFLHGFPLNSFQWRHAIERLSMHRRCIAPDFLGMGYTEVRDGQSVGPDAQVDMLVALLDKLGVRDVDLIANDSGGAVAQLFLVRHPGRVRTLLLTNCDTEIESPPAAMLPVIALAKEGRYVDEWLAPWRADPALARSPAGIGGMCYSNPANPTDEAIETYFAPLLASPRKRAFANAYAIALERNPLAGIAPKLAQVQVPTRVIWGMADTIFSPANADYLDRTLGNSRGVMRFETGKLFWPEEYSDIIAEEARQLWDATKPYST